MGLGFDAGFEEEVAEGTTFVFLGFEEGVGTNAGVGSAMSERRAKVSASSRHRHSRRTKAIAKLTSSLPPLPQNSLILLLRQPQGLGRKLQELIHLLLHIHLLIPVIPTNHRRPLLPLHITPIQPRKPFFTLHHLISTLLVIFLRCAIVVVARESRSARGGGGFLLLRLSGGGERRRSSGGALAPFG